ncbi:ATP-binding protein [Paralcaligenes sp. KSB-10]|uniref:nitrogen regulation protein NR(II) n=1 Tax=Paralcaligenes sp. KSB-10 TaxID=2901142 RepID=UPI001E50F786|nr:nitrogen regulation protein NR(II) [Paralcaligenes sp. KSB-10]UHL64722.1 ATP-binding protein [Paralcaligenes sp. KSB-10]
MDIASYDLLATAVVLLDEHGRVAHVNAAAEELFGLSRRQLSGVFGHALFNNADAALKARFGEAIQGKFGVLRQDLSINRPGTSIPVSLTLVHLQQQDWAALLEVRELEHHVLLERNRHLSQELDVQRESLRNLAHEVKNPLGGIRGGAQLLEAELGDESLREYTQVIMAEADRLTSLVDRLIIPQGASLNRARFNIHEICERVYTLARAEYGSKIEIVRDYDASAPELMGDLERLLQALLNMVRNAAQALTESTAASAPKLVLRTRIGRQLMLATQPVKMGIVVSVIDNGPGVPVDLHDKIFHPLVTGRASGTGLGLSLAQEFVQQHGGVIEFDSTAGHTEFRMILPLELP